MENATVREIAKYRARKRNNAAYRPRILLAEDDDEMRSLLALMLRKEGYQVTACPDGISLLDQLSFFFLPGQEHEEVDLIISDIRMPGVTGMEILMGAQENADFPPIILITAFGDERTHAQAEQFGAAAMFDKPFDVHDLLDKARELVPI